MGKWSGLRRPRTKSETIVHLWFAKGMAINYNTCNRAVFEYIYLKRGRKIKCQKIIQAV